MDFARFKVLYTLYSRVITFIVEASMRKNGMHDGNLKSLADSPQKVSIKVAQCDEFVKKNNTFKISYS